MQDAQLIKTKVDLAGLMDVLARNLYSTPTVAIRELVQNAHDSCVRRRLERREPFEPVILVLPEHGQGILAIEDNGAGLTRDEIERYLATVGAGYTRKLRAEHGDSGLIGMFGLGFLSAFVVSERVDVFTTSAGSPLEGWHFSSRSGESYTLSPVAPRAIGTRVELLLKPEFRELANPKTVEALLSRYCCLLTIPIHVGSREQTPVNAEPPPWRRDESELPELRKKKLRLELAARFEHMFEPICTFDLAQNEDTLREAGPREGAGARARGLLWIQDGATYGTSDNRNVSVFVRGMLVSRDERDLLPAYAGFVGGVVESNDLTPTASREDLQKDDVYLEIATAMRETLIRGLSTLADRDPPAWRRVLSRHNEALLGAAICDDRLFELLADDLKVPTTEGDLTLPQVLKRSEGKLYVSIGEKGSYEETLFRALLVPIISGTRYAVLPFAGKFGESRGAKVVRLGTKDGNDALFARETLPPADQALLERLLGEEGVEVVPARFKPDYLPIVLTLDREVLLKERLESDEADRRISSAVLGMARLFTEKVPDKPRAQLFVNLDSPVIAQLRRPDVADGRRTHVAVLLRSMSRLMASHREASLDLDLARTLRAQSAAMSALLEG